MSIPRQRWSRRQGFGSAHLGVKKPRRSKIFHSITRDKTLSLAAAVEIARGHETTSKHMKTLTENSKSYQEGRNIDYIRKEQEREFCNNNSSSTTPQGSTTTAGVQMSRSRPSGQATKERNRELFNEVSPGPSLRGKRKRGRGSGRRTRVLACSRFLSPAVFSPATQDSSGREIRTAESLNLWLLF